MAYKTIYSTLAIIMKNTIYIIISLIFFSCQGQNKDLKTNKNANPNNSDYKISNVMKVIFSAYTTAENGLNYRKEPNINSEIIGKLNYGTKVNIVDDYNYSQFSIDDKKRGYLSGKWTGIKKDSTTVYVFNAYLFKSSPEIENHIKLINGKLEVIYTEVRDIDSNKQLIIEMHIQTSNDLADYLIVKLETNKQVVYNHKIEYLFKESYELKRTKDTNTTFEYFTLFDECPSQEYKQTFTVSGNKILKINENYYMAQEE